MRSEERQMSDIVPGNGFWWMMAIAVAAAIPLVIAAMAVVY
jgi:hypothetical protein